MIRNTARACLTGIAWGLFALGSAAHAQSFPAKPVRLVVPFAPGGGTDIMARVLAHKLTDMWGQQTVVDNRGGAGTVIGTELTVKSPPDGYTLMLANIALALNPGLHQKLPYDAAKDLAPIILLASQPNALVVNPTVPAKTLKELVALAKRGTPLSYATSGPGSVGHITGEMFRGIVGGDLVHVPYKGGGPAAVDVMSGQVPMAFISLPTVMGYVKGGKMRLIAISDSKRSSSVPDVPTMSETLPGFEVNNWLGVLAPAAIAKPLVAKLNADMQKALQAPDVREKLFLQGFEVQGGSPELFGKMIHADIKEYTKVIREAHIQAN